MATSRSLPPSLDQPELAGQGRMRDDGGAVVDRGRGDLSAPPELAAAATWPAPITLVRWGIVGIFLVAGSAKLFGLASMVALFRAVGLGQWFRYVVGAGEITGAILLAIPRSMLLGGVILCSLMVGAVGTDVVVLRRLPISSAGTLTLLVIVLWSRWRGKP